MYIFISISNGPHINRYSKPSGSEKRDREILNYNQCRIQSVTQSCKISTSFNL